MSAAAQQIKTLGYTVLPGVVSGERRRLLLDRVEACYDETRDRLPADQPRLVGSDPFVWNLQNKDPCFVETLFAYPQIEALLVRFLNDEWFARIPADQPNYILRSYLARNSRHPLPLHIDSLFPYGGERVIVMQVKFALEDETADNGCTLVVPGSHLSGDYAPGDDTRDAVPVPLEAGDVMIWDSRLWHGAGPNHGNTSRWSLIATYCRWWLKQQFDIPNNLPDNILDALSAKQKAVLGFASLPAANEFIRTDMKRGYDEIE